MNANQIEAHFYLPPGVHSADAYKLISAETDFLSIIKEVACTFGVEFKLETQALSEGGIRQTWKAIGKNAPQISLVLSIVAIIIAMKPQCDAELIELQKQETQLHIQYLKRQLAEDITPESEQVTNAAQEIGSTLKIVRRRSNFYQAICEEEKITSVSFSVFEEDTRIEEPTVVLRTEFADFIALSGELPTEIDEDAVIGIVSPVLCKGKYKWKGEYRGSIIEFWLQDKAFEEMVLRKEVEFHSGTAIKCVLEMRSKINEIYDITTTGYHVRLVKSILDDDYEFTTKSGKFYEIKKQHSKNQLNLFQNTAWHENPSDKK